MINNTGEGQLFYARYDIYCTERQTLGIDICQTITSRPYSHFERHDTVCTAGSREGPNQAITITGAAASFESFDMPSLCCGAMFLPVVCVLACKETLQVRKHY